MSLNGLFLSFSALCDLKNNFEKKISEKFFLKKINFLQKFPIVVPRIFLSLRYGTDLRRSRLVLFSADNLTLNGPLFTIFCSFVQLIFWAAGDRGLDSRTKPQIFYASKSRGETKGAPFGFFFGNMRTFFRKFSNSIKGYPLNCFLKFSVCKNV